MTLVALILTTAVLVTACARVSFFPRRSSTGGPILLARMTGKLVLEGGCLWLASAGQRDLLIWGSTFGTAATVSDIEITKDSSVVAIVGQAITVTGGEVTREGTVPEADSWIESQIGQKIPTDCRLGNYWLVEAVVAASTDP